MGTFLPEGGPGMAGRDGHLKPSSSSSSSSSSSAGSSQQSGHTNTGRVTRDKAASPVARRRPAPRSHLPTGTLHCPLSPVPPPSGRPHGEGGSRQEQPDAGTRCGGTSPMGVMGRAGPRSHFSLSSQHENVSSSPCRADSCSLGPSHSAHQECSALPNLSLFPSSS